MAVQFDRIAPVFATLDLKRALEVYRSLGFETESFGDPNPFYGFIRRDPIEIHIASVPHIDMKTTNSCCYIWASDADTLFAEWQAATTEGIFHGPGDTSYGLREFGYTDRDGNLIRVGSKLESAQSSA